MKQVDDRMSLHTYVALQQSRHYWTMISRGLAASNGPGTCQLCQLHNTTITIGTNMGCGECPVRKATGHNGCVDTPYDTFADKNGETIGCTDRCKAGYADCKTCREIAKEEAWFLQSLVPDESAITFEVDCAASPAKKEEHIINIIRSNDGVVWDVYYPKDCVAPKLANDDVIIQSWTTIEDPWSDHQQKLRCAAIEYWRSFNPSINPKQPKGN